MDTENSLYDKVKRITGQILDVMFMQSGRDNTVDLQEWINDNPTSEETIKMLSDPELLKNELEKFSRSEKYEKTRMLVDRLNRKKLRRKIFYYSGVAASLLLGVFLMYNRERETEICGPIPQQAVPTLILANGECLDLTTMQPEREINRGVLIRSENKNELTYVAQDFQDGFKDRDRENRLVIPRQCTYRVILSDSSVVYVNAESELLYPEKFIGKERRVTLKGEAYFEVRHNSRPFIVNVGEARIKVYGTKFNIDAYSPGRIETLLVEGRVGIAVRGSFAGEKILNPAQLSRLNPQTGEQWVADVNVEKYISWMKGILRYEGDPFGKVIEALERWYGLDLMVDNPLIKEIKVTASIDKDLPFADIMVMLRETLNIEFLKKEGGYLIIQK